MMPSTIIGLVMFIVFNKMVLSRWGFLSFRSEGV
jgi:hypothetical protein